MQTEGLKRSLDSERMLLTDDVVRGLATAVAIKGFSAREQDIEWAYMRRQIYIVQAIPFIAGG